MHSIHVELNPGSWTVWRCRSPLFYSAACTSSIISLCNHVVVLEKVLHDGFNCVGLSRAHSGLCLRELIRTPLTSGLSGRILKNWTGDRRRLHTSRRTSQGFNVAPPCHEPPHPWLLIGPKLSGPRPLLPGHAPLRLLRRCQLADSSVLTFTDCWNSCLKLRCFFKRVLGLQFSIETQRGHYVELFNAQCDLHFCLFVFLMDLKHSCVNHVKMPQQMTEGTLLFGSV